MNVLWFSAGVSSAIVAYLCRDELDEIIYQHIDDQHPDTLRFLHDVERLIGRKITVQQSPLKNVETACRYGNSIRIPCRPPKCSELLKKRERQRWEYEHPGRHVYYWGLDVAEQHRAERFEHGMPQFEHRFPLVERELTKADAHAIARMRELRRPVMYDMGYHNNNCVGCVAGGMGYWNRIRKDFPKVFASRARMERAIGHSCINGVYLDELDPKAGRHDPPIDMECGVYCLLNL